MGVIQKSKHIQLTNLIQNGELVNQKNILEVFKDAGINKDLPMIFYGGDGAYVLKAIADHAGLVPQT
jgi:3-mercaptopyruvate sulfurtransferase SseA